MALLVRLKRARHVTAVEYVDSVICLCFYLLLSAVNDYGRISLVSDMHPLVEQLLATGFHGSMQCMIRHYNSTSYRFMETIPEQLRRRGFRVPKDGDAPIWGSAEDELPGFLYRDYSVPLWYHLRSYVHSVLDPVYCGNRIDSAACDEHLKTDAQVTAWIAELQDHRAADTRMQPVDNYAELCELLTQIIFQATAQHAAIGSGQYDYTSFQPARPTFLTRGMPFELMHMTSDYIVGSLMDPATLMALISLFDILSMCCRNSLFLPDPYDENSEGLLLRDTTITAAFPEQYEVLKSNLRILEAQQRAYNIEKDWRYPYLLPSRVSQSISH
jgi:hypothetical protein